jgi:hypothetical protein
MLNATRESIERATTSEISTLRKFTTRHMQRLENIKNAFHNHGK